MQRNLLQRSIDDIHCAAPSRQIPLMHAVVHYKSWRWYEEELAKLIKDSEKCGNAVTFIGQVPDPKHCDACGVNDHTGRHFNPPMNEYYAELLFDFVREHLPRDGSF